MEQAKARLKNKLKKKIKHAFLLLIKELGVPFILIFAIFILVCYITEIFYIGINNEEKSNMKQEIKYYTTAEYTEEDSKSFFDSVKEFTNGIFSFEFIDDADWPVVGTSTKDITSYYGYRKAPTTGASTYHSRH